MTWFYAWNYLLDVLSSPIWWAGIGAGAALGTLAGRYSARRPSKATPWRGAEPRRRR